MTYECLVVALLVRYEFTERGYCHKFCETKPEKSPSNSSLVTWREYFAKSVKLNKAEQIYSGVVDSIVRKQ